MSLVSIIVPAYNAESTIERAVSSCLAQTYSNIEIVVVDNLSTDNTKIILQKFTKDVRVKIINCDKPGVSYARNMGLVNCEGRYVCFLDADDELLVDSVSKRVAILKKQDTIFVSTAYIRRHGTNDKLIEGRPVNTNLFNWCNPVGNLTGLYDAREIGIVYQEARHHEDYLMWWNVVELCGEKISYITDPTAIYHVTPGSLSSSFYKNLKGHFSILRQKNNKYNPMLLLYIINYIFNGLRKRFL